MFFKHDRIINIYFSYIKDSPFIRVLLEMPERYLIYQNLTFYISNDKQVMKRFKWERVNNYKIEDDIYITELKESEGTGYFVKFSNDDILYIHQTVHGYGDWYEEVEVVQKSDNGWYQEVHDHMNEDWVEKITLLNQYVISSKKAS